MIRLQRVIAIGWQDLRSELKGRQGLVLPAVIASLLAPASLIPSRSQQVAEALTDEKVVVQGDVPPEILGNPDIDPNSRYPLTFRRDEAQVLLLDGMQIPSSIRATLDGPDPAVRLHLVPRGYVFPGRTLLLSLITASTLTGAVAQSIGGERSRKTLVVLLAAAVSKWEIVVGKWAAWAAFGAASSYLAAAVAIATGNVAPGLWLIPLPWVPAATVAVGLWVVRRASDVMAGSATTLRVLPAALSITAVIAWLLGHLASPWLGALVPLGGALIAAGNTWPTLGPVLVATGSTVLLTAAALVGTVRDLEENEERAPPEDAWPTAALVAVVGGLVWWMAIAGPELWTLAGNPRITEALAPSRGLWAGAIGLGLFSAVRALRGRDGWARELQIRWPSAGGWLAALVGAASLWAVRAGGSFLPPLTSGAIATRLSAAVQPDPASTGWPVVLMVILADELLFRGWLPKITGPFLATAVWVVVRCPSDPLAGVLIGTVCAVLAARDRGPVLPIAARLAAVSIG